MKLRTKDAAAAILIAGIKKGSTISDKVVDEIVNLYLQMNQSQDEMAPSFGHDLSRATEGNDMQFSDEPRHL